MCYRDVGHKKSLYLFPYTKVNRTSVLPSFYKTTEPYDLMSTATVNRALMVVWGWKV